MRSFAARAPSAHLPPHFHHRSPAALLALLALIALLASPRAARADEWLSFRHDARRTAASSGSCDLARPAIGWQRYVGGAVSRVIAYDVDHDGSNEIVFASGGRVLAKRPDDTVVWESPLVGGVTLLGVLDVDHDGADELLAATFGGPDVFLLALRDGAVRWHGGGAPQFQAVTSVRLADLDGDGRDDLYVADCGCCTLNGSVIAAAYSFAAPATIATPRQLWTLGPEAAGCGHGDDQIGDVDGDGAPEVIVTNRVAEFTVFDGRTGRLESRAPAPSTGDFYPATVAYLRNIDADPALEMVVVSNGFAVSVGGAKRVAVYDWAGGAWSLLWQDAGTDRANDAVFFEPDGAAVDLDGDMTLETAYSLQSGGVTTLNVRDARSGAVRASRAGATLRGVVDLDADGRPELLVRIGADLHAMNYRGGMLVDRWTLAGQSPLRQVDTARLIRRTDAAVTLALQFDDDPPLELVLIDDARATITAYDADGAAPHAIGSFAVDPGTTFLLEATVGPVSRTYPQLAAVLSDGYLLVFDRAMHPTNRLIDTEFRFLGMRVGGYVTPTLRVARFDDGPGVITAESRGALVRLDARGSSVASPPRVSWTRTGATAPLIADLDGDGVREITTVEGRDVVALDAATATRERWRASGALPLNGGLLGDLLPATRRGMSGTDVMFVANDPGTVFHARALRGSDGSSRWPGYTRAICCGFQPVSVADVNGDGVDDMVAVNNSAFTVSGADGTLLANDPTGSIYSLPMVGDMAGDGSTTVWIHGGHNVDRLLDAATLATRATRTDRTSPNTGAYGARVTCGGAPAVVEATFQSNLLFTVRPRDASLVASVALADGEVYPPGMVPPAATRVGYTGVATAVADLDGRGTPAVLVNSTDGFLYALDPCTLRKIWSLDFRYATGEPVVGDTDGDGHDEVLLGCADGNLYRLANAAYGSPAPVLDTDPPGGRTSVDVEQIATIDTLYASWTAVPGATAYDVAVLTASGTAVTNPVYRNVGAATTATISGLPLRRDQRYVIAVRPSGPMGSGIEALSNGVTVRESSPPAVDVVVTPPQFWPPAGQRAQIVATLRARIGLAHRHVQIERPDGTVVRVLEDAVASGEMSEARLTWDGTDMTNAPVPAGRYVAAATATSVTGLMGSGSAEVVVDPAAATSGDGGARDAGADGGRRPASDSGCGCRAAGATRQTPTTRAWHALAALLVLAGATRRPARRRRQR